ncbi:MAG: branched-chain amino acid ABC transporter permease [Burkholderiaceae bacterium]
MSLEVILQVLIGGVLLGGLYALVAFGLSLIYGVVRILNFAHGTLLAVSGVLASLAFSAWGLHPVLIALLLAPLVFVLAFAFYHGLLRPLAKRSHFESTVGTVLVTVGALLILSDVTAKLAGSTQRNIQLRLPALEFGQIVVSTTQLLILVGIVALTVIMHLLLKRTWFGRAVRAVTQDPVGAQICGVPSVRIKALTFAFGSATVAVAAVLYVLSFPVDPYMGFGLTVKAFTIIIVGGIGNLPGALAAGIFLGVAEGLTGLFWKPEWAPALSVILMLLILVIWPKRVGGHA